jgi:hypothetical protein
MECKALNAMCEATLTDCKGTDLAFAAALLDDYTLNTIVTPPAACNTLAPQTKLPILRAAQFTLRRALQVVLRKMNLPE